MTHSFLRPVALVGACATAVLLLAVLGSSAQAASLAACTGTDSVTYSPAMTLTSHSGTIGYLDTVSCTSSDPGAATGSTGGSFTRSYSCVDLAPPTGTTATLPITWADSTTSAFSYTSIVGALVGGSYILTAVGSISSGKFAGAAVTLVIADPALSLLQCLTTGIASNTGVVTLTITSA
jgi:hypothetical protein